METYVAQAMGASFLTDVHVTHLGNHVINEPVLVPDAQLLELALVLPFIDVLEDHQELAIILFENGVLGGKVQGPASTEGCLNEIAQLFLVASCRSLRTCVHLQAKHYFLKA